MLKEKQILDTLDHSTDETYNIFINLGDTYSYLIDSRLTIFTDDDDHWAIVGERLGYNPRASAIDLKIIYFGNCLTNLRVYNDKSINYYNVWPIESDNFLDITTDGGALKKNADYLIVRGEKIELVHSKQVYADAGINSRPWSSDKIQMEDVGRLAIQTHASLFRATDQELYKCIPEKLKKILVIDEWYHKDFSMQQYMQDLSEERLKEVYEFNRQLKKDDLSFESFATSYKNQLQAQQTYLNQIQLKNRPSSYETWKMIAKVIVTKDPSNYKPKLKPNSNWKNWPKSGSM
jgi:hypothetical protein